MVADTEIAARRRGGIEWRTPEAVAVSVLARPETLDPSAVDVGWAAVGLAAARALDACRDGRRSCLWPDLIACEPDDDLEVAVNSVCTLGPGRVELAALTVRVGPLGGSEERTRVTDGLLLHLREAVTELDHPASILHAYRERCSTLGRAVELRLLPHGSMRGTAADIDDAGQLVLASPTGLRERIAVASVNEVRLLPSQ